MLNLQSLSLKVAGLDISEMVLSLTMFETIKGNIRGSFQVQDNINFYDTFIGHVQPLIKIKFKYIGISCTNNFYGDGINNMEISKLGKNYTIHFIAFPTVNMQITQINHVYSGLSHEIIKNIFKEANGKNNRLRIDSKAITKGRYVVPNIKAQTAIKNVLSSAYDDNDSSFCLYQRVYDRGATRLTSLHDMSENYFYENELIGTNYIERIFTIKNVLAGVDEESDGLSSLNTVGTSSSFNLKEFQMNFTAKLAAGQWGSTISHIYLDETKIVDNPVTEITDPHITRYKLSAKLYDNDVKSIFSTEPDPVCYAAQHQRARVWNQQLGIINVVAIPNIGVGFSVNIDQGGSNISSSRQDNQYIIANINHKFIKNDGKFEYSQDMGLIRE